MLTNAIRLIDESLSSHSLLVSDAIGALSKLIRKHASETNLSAVGADYYAQVATTLNKELLGYDKPDWDLENPYRQCKADIVRKIAAGDQSTYKLLKTECFVAVWGVQQIETHLSEVLDLSALMSGNDELIASELQNLMRTNYVVYSESGISSDLWLKFSILEMVRIYFQIKAMICELCKILVRALEAETSKVFNADPCAAVMPTTAIMQSFTLNSLPSSMS